MRPLLFCRLWYEEENKLLFTVKHTKMKTRKFITATYLVVIAFTAFALQSCTYETLPVPEAEQNAVEQSAQIEEVPVDVDAPASRNNGIEICRDRCIKNDDGKSDETELTHGQFIPLVVSDDRFVSSK